MQVSDFLSVFFLSTSSILSFVSNKMRTFQLLFYLCAETCFFWSKKSKIKFLFYISPQYNVTSYSIQTIHLWCFIVWSTGSPCLLPPPFSFVYGWVVYSLFWGGSPVAHLLFWTFSLSASWSFYLFYSNCFTNVPILSKELLLRLLDMFPHKSTCSGQIPQLIQPYVHLSILPHCRCQSQS